MNKRLLGSAMDRSAAAPAPMKLPGAKFPASTATACECIVRIFPRTMAGIIFLGGGCGDLLRKKRFGLDSRIFLGGMW